MAQRRATRVEPFEKWDQQDLWSITLPPSRPSASDLAFVRDILVRKGPQLRVCVLGSTPELRDLCVELDAEMVCVIDRSRRFFEQVDRLRVFPNAPEVTVFDDWNLALAEMPNAFDVVLSDLTLGNITYDGRADFFAGISSALRPGGLFVDRVLTHPRALLELDMLDAKYESMPLNLQTANDFANEYFFVSQLVTSGTVDVRLSSETLGHRYGQRPRLARLLAEASDLLTPTGIWFYGKPWDEVAPGYAVGLEKVAQRFAYESGPFSGFVQLMAHMKVAA